MNFKSASLDIRSRDRIRIFNPRKINKNEQPTRKRMSKKGRREAR